MYGFSEIVGQDRAVGRIQAALRSNRVPHAYLFVGPAGSGKLDAAWALAQALLCPNRVDEGCGQCQVCLKVQHGHHPDVLLLQPDEGKRRIAIAQVRKLQESLPYRPYEGSHRIILVPDAHVMTEEAANALLKTLEEPPDRTHFVLTTAQPSSLLDTIRSRCQTIRFAPHPREAIAQTLVRERSLDERMAMVLAGLAEGSPGRAMELLDRDILSDMDEAVGKVVGLSLQDPKAILETSERWQRDRDRVIDRLDLLISWYRDRLLESFGVSGDLLIHQDRPQTRTSPSVALRALDLLLDSRSAIEERNANLRLTLDNLFTNLAMLGEAQ